MYSYVLLILLLYFSLNSFLNYSCQYYWTEFVLWILVSEIKCIIFYTYKLPGYSITIWLRQTTSKINALEITQFLYIYIYTPLYHYISDYAVYQQLSTQLEVKCYLTVVVFSSHTHIASSLRISSANSCRLSSLCFVCRNIPIALLRSRIWANLSLESNHKDE